QSEEAMWQIDAEIANSGGNLCLHLVGNLKTFIGLKLGDFAYERDREFEFGGKDVPKATLLQQIDETVEIVTQSLAKLTESDLQKVYPFDHWEGKPSIEFALIHLAMHLSYHLGQINYHRRMLDR
ncbi:MAG: DinB family protein, partial [Bacteroidota bacterium]